MRLVFANRVSKDLRKIDSAPQKRIIEKLAYYCDQDNPLRFGERLVNNPYGSLRFRIGDYRAIADVDKQTITITVIGHRKEIYR